MQNNAPVLQILVESRSGSSLLGLAASILLVLPLRPKEVLAMCSKFRILTSERVMPWSLDVIQN